MTLEPFLIVFLLVFLSLPGPPWDKFPSAVKSTTSFRSAAIATVAASCNALLLRSVVALMHNMLIKHIILFEKRSSNQETQFVFI
jgi:hypothetical protein